MTQIRYQVTWTAMVDGEVKPWLRCNADGSLYGLATAANQATANTSLASIDTKFATDAVQVLAWDGSAHSTTGYSSAYIEVTTYNTAITVKGGIAANNPMQVLNLLDNSTAATITATGLHVVPAVGNISLTGLGSGVVNLLLKR